MQLQPYVFFNGRCEEALNFYREAIGAQIESLIRYKDSPDQSHVPPGGAEKIMHASARLGDGQLLASDGHLDPNAKFSGFSLSLSVANPEEGKRVFDALSTGGKVDLPFGPQFWTTGFGMLTDRFGVSWMVSAEH